MLEMLLAVFVIELGVYIQHTIARDMKYDKINEESARINEIERKRYAEMQLQQIEAQKKTATAVKDMVDQSKEESKNKDKEEKK